MKSEDEGVMQTALDEKITGLRRLLSRAAAALRASNGHLAWGAAVHDEIAATYNNAAVVLEDIEKALFE